MHRMAIPSLAGTATLPHTRYEVRLYQLLFFPAIPSVIERPGLIRCSPVNLGPYRTNKQDLEKKRYKVPLTYFIQQGPAAPP